MIQTDCLSYLLSRPTGTMSHKLYFEGNVSGNIFLVEKREWCDDLVDNDFKRNVPEIFTGKEKGMV